MKNLKVTVNGKTYDVTVEEVNGAVSAPAVPVKATEQTSAPAAPATPAPAAPAPAAGDGDPINCPMPGTILSINVSAGQSVKKGDTLMILEAMKMENEISAPRDGVITSVACAKGESVESGKLLATIK